MRAAAAAEAAQQRAEATAAEATANATCIYKQVRVCDAIMCQQNSGPVDRVADTEELQCYRTQVLQSSP